MITINITNIFHVTVFDDTVNGSSKIIQLYLINLI